MASVAWADTTQKNMHCYWCGQCTSQHLYYSEQSAPTTLITCGHMEIVDGRQVWFAEPCPTTTALVIYKCDVCGSLNMQECPQ